MVLYFLIKQMSTQFGLQQMIVFEGISYLFIFILNFILY